MNDLLKPIDGAREYASETVVGPFTLVSGRPSVRVQGYEQTLKAMPVATEDGNEHEVVVWKENVPTGKLPYVGIMPKTSVMLLDGARAAITFKVDNKQLFAVRSLFGNKWYNPVEDAWTSLEELSAVTVGLAHETSFRGNKIALFENNKRAREIDGKILYIWHSYVVSNSMQFLPEVHLTYDEAWEVIKEGKI